jgi:tetratricopeptide (TPR) repeat protein
MRHVPPSLILVSIALMMGATLSVARAEDATALDPLLQEARSAEARFDAKGALALYLRAESLSPDNPKILQKIAQQYSDTTNDTTDPVERKLECTKALGYARRAAELDPKSAVNLLSVAICYGKLATLSDTRTRIEYSRLVKDYAERALAIDPNYDYAHHVLGRWNYEVASLGIGTRIVVKLIYGGLPPASTAEAVRHLRRAIELAPQRPSHRVELGFALLADGQRDAARAEFAQALKMPQVEKYDTEEFRRARAALQDGTRT